MMKSITYLFAALFISLAACKKDDNTATVNTGSIRYTNTSTNPYEMYLDGADKGAQPGNTYSTIGDVPAGSHVVKAVQNSGYTVYATTRTATLTVVKGQEVSFVFP